MDKRNCGNCKWWEEFNGVCFNGESDNAADYTEKDFLCDCHEIKGDNDAAR